MADTVEFGKDSIQLPYRRFLADSAAGLVAIAAVVLTYYVFGSHRLGAPTEVKIFLLFVLFLLATPIGFAANAISWIILGNAIALVERFCFTQTTADSNIFVTSHVALARQMQTLTNRFALNADNFRETGSLFRDLMESDILAKLAPPSNARELMIFLRSMALFAFVAAMVVLAATQTPQRHEFTVAVGLAICIALSFRVPSGWRRLSRLRLVLSIGLVVTSVVGVVLLVSNSSKPWLPITLIVISVLAVLVAGIVDYYHYSYVLLHTYFALEALGIKIDGSADRSAELMKAASALFGEATKIARGVFTA
jgi:hypothetical protein